MSSAGCPGDAGLWCVDPIDGTVQFPSMDCPYVRRFRPRSYQLRPQRTGRGCTTPGPIEMCFYSRAGPRRLPGMVRRFAHTARNNPAHYPQRHGERGLQAS
jgi:hypothetical protein